MHEQIVRVVRRWWWLILAVTAAGTVAAYGWSRDGSGRYEAYGTYLVQPRTLEASDEIRALETLIDTEEIPSTFAGVARSDRIVALSLAEIGIAADEHPDLEVRTEVVAGTNILRIGARGQDPALVRHLAGAVGELTAAYVDDLDDVFALSIIDEPRTPTQRSTAGTATIAGLGAILGLVVGLAVALGTERVVGSTVDHRVRQIRDPQSKAYHERYLKLRFHEELSRCLAGDHSFSLGVLQVMRPGRELDGDAPAHLSTADLVAIAALIQSSLREQDILGHLGRGCFAAILPAMDIGEARQLVEVWRTAVTGELLKRPLRNDVAISVGVCAYDSSVFVGDRDAERVASTL